MNRFIAIKIIFLIVSIVASSWLMVHVMAIFGVFLALAYPLMWLLFPQKTVCFFCRSGRDGSMCPLCHREIHKEQGVSPSSFTSILLNSAVLLLLAFLSIGVVYGESKLLAKFGFPPASKTVSFAIPNKGEYRLEEIFPMRIEIAGVKSPVNAIQADLSFSPEKLQLVDFSTEGSFANIFIQKEINNTAGYARLTGGLPNPGFFSDKGLFGTAYFKGVSPGIVSINFLPSSMVLANDGKGTNVLKDLASVSYLILPEKITYEEEKLQKNITLHTPVLGESTDQVQMKFFEEPQVLGESVTYESGSVAPFNAFHFFFDLLAQIDGFILLIFRKAIAYILGAVNYAVKF